MSSPLPGLLLSEFIASEDGSAFWKFVESTKDIYSTVTTDKGRWCSPLPPPSASCSRVCPPELYDEVLELSWQLLPPLTHDVLSLSLSLHTHSPAIEMYQQVGMERLKESLCEAAVEVGGKLVCSVEEVLQVLQEEDDGRHTIQLFSFDHQYPSAPSTPPPPSAVLYAELGTQPFSYFHSALVGLAKERKINYVLRHYIRVSV